MRRHGSVRHQASTGQRISVRGLSALASDRLQCYTRSTGMECESVPGGKKRAAGFLMPNLVNTVKQTVTVAKVFGFAVMGALCSCASPSQVTPVARAREPIGTQVGRGAVNGFRYAIGVPLSLGMTIFGPLAGVSPSAGIQMLQDLHDYKLPD